MSGDRKMAAAALVISVFVAGLVGGAATMNILRNRPRPGFPMEGGPGAPPGMDAPWFAMRDSMPEPPTFAPMAIHEMLAERLNLSEDQREKVQALMEERQRRASNLMRELAEPLRAPLDSMNNDIRALLSPSQAEIFDEFVEREDAFGPGPGQPAPEHPGRKMPPGRG